jgi:copper chaperone CopZ/cytochrome c biogenesis protein CcdA
MLSIGFRARGMHCHGCEHIIEYSVHRLPGVQSVKADYPTEIVEVVFDPAVTRLEDICVAVTQKGYQCVLPSDFGPKPSRLKKLAGLALGLLGIALIILIDTELISESGAPDISQHMSYGLIFLLGVLTGFHCIGMCGGFVLTYTADAARSGKRSYLSHLSYGAGKTLSYTVIGATLGLLDAVVTFTPLLRGVAGVIAGVFLIIFGLNMLGTAVLRRWLPIPLPSRRIVANLSVGENGEAAKDHKYAFRTRAFRKARFLASAS